MPQNINGCGTMYCGHSAAVHWTKPVSLSTQQADHDAVVCVTLFMLPLIPLRPVHIYDHSGMTCRELRIRWSKDLVWRAFLRPWLFLIIAMSGVCLLILAVGVSLVIWTGSIPSTPKAVIFSAITVISFAASIIGHWWLNAHDARNRDIRPIL